MQAVATGNPVSCPVQKWLLPHFRICHISTFGCPLPLLLVPPPRFHPPTTWTLGPRWNATTSAGATISPLPSLRDVGATSSPTTVEDGLVTSSDQWKQAGQGTANVRGRD